MKINFTKKEIQAVIERHALGILSSETIQGLGGHLSAKVTKDYDEYEVEIVPKEKEVEE